MKRALLGPAVFATVVVVIFVALAELVTAVSAGRERGRSADDSVSVEAGEALFWGKGKCSTCHAVNGRGGAIRGPDQGTAGPLRLAIGARAEARAAERSRATGRRYTSTDYLVESLLDPGAYVVSGYKNEMPNPLRPPIALAADQVRAVILYLQSLGGRPDVAAIHLPAAAFAAAAAAASASWQPYLRGDPVRGRALFFDDAGNAGCGRCHRVGERGGDVGPALTHVAGTRDARFLLESILEPSRVIASGYEPVLVVTRDERYVTGIVRHEDERTLDLVDAQGRLTRVPKASIVRRAPQALSLMPQNFAEILTVEELHDLLAYLSTLT